MAREAVDRRALEVLDALPHVPLGHYPTPVEEMSRLRAALGSGPRLLVKRDDAISFGFGGNKVRKLELVVARALALGADTLITTGGVQSNHARATAAAAARLGLHCVIVANGQPPERLTGNALLDRLLGAELEYVATREERAPRMRAIAADLAARGRRPHLVPLGASTPLGALGLVGEGYGIPSDASREAQQLAARLEAIFVEHWYTAKALAGLIAGVRSGRLRQSETVLFWHTGGQASLFA